MKQGHKAERGREGGERDEGARKICGVDVGRSVLARSDAGLAQQPVSGEAGQVLQRCQRGAAREHRAVGLFKGRTKLGSVCLIRLGESVTVRFIVMMGHRASSVAPAA